MEANELMIGDWVTLNGVDYQWQWTHHDFTASEFSTLTPYSPNSRNLGEEWVERSTILARVQRRKEHHSILFT